ncbi:MAG: class I SAM-dependent methyltransferase [Gammaproteobacteria bacterium]|nr:class I SAM-dependent methyltransferase [Gammaproteobacteria bacterium]
MENPSVDRQFADPRLAALYDRLHPLSPVIRDFYLPPMLAAPAVLDVGCGTGALLKAARAAGHRGRLCGLDPAPAMLAVARARADVEWTEGDAASMRFEREFDLAVMSGHAFQALRTDAAIGAALAALRRALKPTGRLIFDTRNPGARAWERWTPEHAVELRDADGTRVRVTLEVVAPFDGRRVVFLETYSGPHWSEPLASRCELRFCDARELGEFLGQAGFLIEAQFGDFDRSALAPASPEILTLARLTAQAGSRPPG